MNDFLTLLSDVFGTVVGPVEMSIEDAMEIDSYGASVAPDPPSRSSAALRRWSDVPDGLLESSPEALHYLDARSAAFYVPAYMSWSFRNATVSESMSLDAVSSFITNSVRDRGRGREGASRNYIDIINTQQLEVVRRYLRFASDDTLETHFDHWMALEALNAIEGC